MKRQLLHYVPSNCTTCGAPFDWGKQSRLVTCSYCGQKFIIDSEVFDEINNIVKSENIISSLDSHSQVDYSISEEADRRNLRIGRRGDIDFLQEDYSISEEADWRNLSSRGRGDVDLNETQEYCVLIFTIILTLIVFFIVLF